MKISEIILKTRKTHQLTQKEFASQINVSRSLVARWENNLNLPNSENLKDISEKFNISLNDLYQANRHSRAFVQRTNINSKNANKLTFNYLLYFYIFVSVFTFVSYFIPMLIVWGRGGPDINLLYSIISIPNVPLITISIIMSIILLTISIILRIKGESMTNTLKKYLLIITIIVFISLIILYALNINFSLKNGEKWLLINRPDLTYITI